MALHVHRAERTDLLADALGDLLARPLPDPFAEEVVVVPARGVERWLTQRLSHRLGAGPRGGDGVCAGVRFSSPRSLVSLLLGRDRDDPWDPDQLVWPLLGVVDDALGEPGFEVLSRHLGHDDPPGDDLRRARRWSVTHRLARLFASYAAQRPRLVEDWSAGDDTDGCGRPLDADLAWQPELWRRLVGERAGAGVVAPQERHRATVASLAAGGDGLDLPPRLGLFGHTRLAETEIDLLRALAGVRDVHLWLPQVSGALWDDLADTAREGRVLRAEDASVARAGHPLLASLGRDARELRRSLGVPDADEVLPAPTPPPTLLGWLQADLRAGARPDEDARAGREPREEDRSVQVHACHGPARQVDVLREVLLGLLQDSADRADAAGDGAPDGPGPLEPRDVLVMCPDVEAYAPLVSAAFGLADLGADPGDGTGHPAHRLRVRLADRSPGATNPLLQVAAGLVDLAGGRVQASQVLDLAAAAPVRRRFGFDDDALDRLAHWAEGSAIRWGLDAAHRSRWGLDLAANTWADGLRRVCLGAATASDGHRVVAGVLPLDDVGDGDLDLVGRVVELVDRLEAFVTAASAAVDAAGWTSALTAALDGLTATDPDEAWQRTQVDRELARLGADGDGLPASTAGSTPASDGDPRSPAPLRHADVRALFRHRLGGRPTRSNFRTGTLTVCTMVPMRSVPHRVVCLLGLDDDAFPRSPVPDGDDVLARRPRTGERDPRSEDRQLLLDAIGAATETLVVTYTGRGVHTGAARPPSVPLGELLDALDATTAEPVRGRVVRAHPLQPHDEASMTPGALGGDRPFTFDASAVAGARAARDPAPAEPRLVPVPLGPPPVEDLELTDLHDFLAHPVRSFLRGRLGVGTGLEHDEVGDAVPLDLDGLESWAVGDRLVRGVLAGVPGDDARAAELLRGDLPPAALGERAVDKLVEDARKIVREGFALRRGRPRAVDVDIRLRDGRRLTGTVTDVFGNDLVRVSYSRLAAKHRLAGWLDALALAAGREDESFTVHTVGRHRSGAQRALLPPLGHRAVGWLSDLVELMDRGRCEPLPMPVRASLAWAEQWRLERIGQWAACDDRARREWVTPRFADARFPTEDADPWHVLAFGDRAAYDLLAAPPRDGDPVGPRGDDGTAPVPGHRLGRYAWALWGPLLEEAGERVQPL